VLGRLKQLVPEVDAVVTAVDETEVDVRHHLALAGTWARTLDEGWSALSESDRHAAVQSIRRNVERTLAALDAARLARI